MTVSGLAGLLATAGDRRSATPTFLYGTVTSVSPLQVTVDGAVTAVSAFAGTVDTTYLGLTGTRVVGVQVGTKFMVVEVLGTGLLPSVQMFNPGLTLSTLSTFVALTNYSGANHGGDLQYNLTTGVVTVTRAGWYNIEATVRMDNGTSGRQIAAIFLAGAELIRLGDETGAYTKSFSGGGQFSLGAGSTIDLRIWNSITSAWSNGYLTMTGIPGTF